MDTTEKIILVVGLLVVWSVYSTVSKHMRKRRIIHKLEFNPVILDVRSASEYNAGHYDGAINVPLQKLDRNLKRVGSKEKPVIVYGTNGALAGRARSILRAYGYKDVTNAGNKSGMP